MWSLHTDTDLGLTSAPTPGSAPFNFPTKPFLARVILLRTGVGVIMAKLGVDTALCRTTRPDASAELFPGCALFTEPSMKREPSLKREPVLRLFFSDFNTPEEGEESKINDRLRVRLASTRASATGATHKEDARVAIGDRKRRENTYIYIFIYKNKLLVTKHKRYVYDVTKQLLYRYENLI